MDDGSLLTFPKNERICWKRHLDLIFIKGMSFVVYPFRVIYIPVKKEEAIATVSVVISVSKKKFKHAVDRNLIKRRIRESYRMQKQEMTDYFNKENTAVLVAFLYISKDKLPFCTVDKAMTKAIYLLIKNIK